MISLLLPQQFPSFQGSVVVIMRLPSPLGPLGLSAAWRPSSRTPTAVSGSDKLGTRPGKRLHSELENHHAIHGKIHYFNGHFQ